MLLLICSMKNKYLWCNILKLRARPDAFNRSVDTKFPRKTDQYVHLMPIKMGYRYSCSNNPVVIGTTPGYWHVIVPARLAILAISTTAESAR